MDEIDRIKARVAALEQINTKKQIDENTDPLSKDMSPEQQFALGASFLLLIIVFVYYMYNLIVSNKSSDHSIASIYITVLLTVCFIILDFCPFNSKKKRVYTLLLRFLTAIFLLLGFYWLK